MSTTSQKTQSFTFTLAGATELTDEIANALFEAGCDDALFRSRGETLYLDFGREAATFDEAVASARADVERAGVGLIVVRVEGDGRGA